ncbi:xanthine dehydrogenase family protein molybdopterin-binding subunit [Pseudonocardia nigra]|uniref:xanthine dehydrogenase family protein molybdopterin-binding subunit n=1 Tax=Pseudonocardia nigra TaxID=1921578 RepID=UPI0027E38013|nr:xanthine dehydrogenase family protein molybdopterin-binding subunit [Pseudonocardia nigra]
MTSVLQPSLGQGGQVAHRLVGASVPRREDERLLSGRGRFVADLAAGAHAVVFVRSTQPHAVIDGIDATSALAMPGVIGVYTGEDLRLARNYIGALHEPHPEFASATRFTMADQRLPVLPVDRVHYVGQPLAAVVAVNRYAGEDAAEAVDVSYTPLPVQLDPDAALAPDAAPLHPHLASNEAATIAVDVGNAEVDAGPDGVVVEGTYRVGRHGAVPLEGRGVVARVDSERVTVWTSTQIPHMVRRGICEATGWTTDHVRVVVPDVGGGFGTKANVYAEEVAVAALARLTGRDLAWIEDRQEHLVSSAQGRDQTHRTRLTLDADGRILLWEDDVTIDIGAGGLWVAGVVANTAIHALGPYRAPNVRVRGRAAFTNKTIVAQYRGAGRPEACFALERSLDNAARRLGISGEEIRRRNLLTAQDLPYPRPLPYRDGVPISYDGGDYARCLDAALELLPRSEVDTVAAQHPDMAVGFGVSCYLEATGRGPYETGMVRLTATGRFEVSSGAASAGQAHETTFGQVAADALGVDLDKVSVRRTDTDTVVHGVGTFASRSAVLAGSAIRKAADELRHKASRRAAKMLGVPENEIELSGDGFSAVDDDLGRRVTWEVLAAACAPGGVQEELGPLGATEVFRPRTVTWTMGAHVAVVGVHRRSGVVSVLRYAVAHEGGVEINPQVVDGQVVGGVAQGIGGALFEEFRYAPDGQPRSTTLADYLLPSSCEVPDVAVRHLPVDTPSNPLGVRGAGESGTIAVGATVCAAVDDALGGAVHVAATPIDHAMVRSALRQQEVA